MIFTFAQSRGPFIASIVLLLAVALPSVQAQEVTDAQAANRYAMKAMKLFSFEAVGELPNSPTNQELEILRRQLGLSRFDRAALAEARDDLSDRQVRLVCQIFDGALKMPVTNGQTVQEQVKTRLLDKMRVELAYLKGDDANASEETERTPGQRELRGMWVGRTVSTKSETEVWAGEEKVADVPAGTEFKIEKVERSWLRGVFQIDGRATSGWVSIDAVVSPSVVVVPSTSNNLQALGDISSENRREHVSSRPTLPVDAARSDGTTPPDATGTHPTLVPQVSHLSPVRQAQFSPDGKRLVTISQEAVVVWDVESGRILRRFNNDSPGFEARWCVDASCKTLLAANYDPYNRRGQSLLSLYDLSTGKLTWQFHIDFGYDTGLMALSPNGRSFYIVSMLTSPKQTICHFDFETTRRNIRMNEPAVEKIPIPVMANEIGICKRLMVSSDGRRIARVSSEGVAVADIASGRTLLRAGNVAPHTDGASTTGNLFQVLASGGPKRIYLTSDFDHAGNRLVMSTYDSAELFDVDRGRLLRRFESSRGVPLSSASISRDGDQVVLFYIDGRAEVCDSDTGRLIRAFTPSDASVSAMGKVEEVALAGLLPRLREIQQGRIPAEYIAACQSTLESSVRSAGGAWSTTINPAAVQQLALDELVRYLPQLYLNMPLARFTPNGKAVLTGLPGTSAMLWETQSGDPLLHLSARSAPMNAVSVSARGMIATDNRTLYDRVSEHFQLLIGPAAATKFSSGAAFSCFDTVAGRHVSAVGAGTGGICAWALCQSGHCLATGKKNGELSFHDTEAGHLRQTVQAHHPVLALEAPLTAEVVLAKSLGDASCYDTSTGSCLFEYSGGSTTGGYIRSRISPDGRIVAVDEGKGELALFDARSGKVLHTLVYCRRPGPNKSLLEKPSNPCEDFIEAAEYWWNLSHRLEFSPDGRRIGISANQEKLRDDSSGSPKNLCVFDTLTGKQVLALDVNDTLFSFIDDEKVVFSAGERTTARVDGWFVHDLRTGESASLPFPDEQTQYFHQIIASPNAHHIACIGVKRLLIYDTESLQITADTTRAELNDGLNNLRFTHDGRFLLLPSRVEGQTTFLDACTGEEIGSLIRSADSDDWLFVTPQGLFDGSAGGRESICFRVGDGLNVVPVDRFFQDFYYPGLLAAIWRGERPKPDVVLGEELPPLLVIDSPQSGDVEQNRVTLTVTAKDQGGGIKGPSLKHNGARLIGAVQSTERIEAGIRRTFAVDLVQGENVLEIVSASADGSFESEPARLVLRYSKPLPKSRLHVLVVGINDYSEPTLTMHFPVRDADRIAQVFAQRGGTLYEDVHVVSLQNEAATSAGILRAIGSLAEQARPQDTVVVFLAGHGSLVDQTFYFLPHEFRRGDDSLEAAIRQKAIPAANLGDALAQVPALKRMIVFDTGQSGGALPVRKSSRNPFAFRGAVERLSRAQGAFTIASSSLDERGREVEELGHGILAYSLLAGLKAVGDGPLVEQWVEPSGSDKVAHAMELFSFASSHTRELGERYFGHAPDVQYSSSGTTFPVLPILADRKPRASEVTTLDTPAAETDSPVDAEHPVGNTLYVVAVGVNRYEQSSLNLRYAAPDAEAIAELFRKRSRALFANVQVKLLLDESATRQQILDAVEAVAEKAKPEDTLALFLAGHGTMVGQRYFFLPHDFKSGTGQMADDIREQGLAADRLGDAVSQVPANQRLLIFDTCASGGAIHLSSQGDDPFAFRGAVEQLGKTGGTFTLAAVGSSAEAQEVDDLGHGLLTYALLSAASAVETGPLVERPLRPAAARGVADVLEWFSYAAGYVPRLSKQYFGAEQQVQLGGHGKAFQVLRVIASLSDHRLDAKTNDPQE